MSRKRSTDEAGFGSDSFMDVIANVVGILIILVIFVGLRAKQMPVALPVESAADAEVVLIGDQVHELEAETAQVRTQLASLAGGAASRLADQARLNQLIADKQEALEQQSAAEAAALERQSELQKEYSVAAAYLARLNTELADLQQPRPGVKSTLIESYPTPISRVVEGDEIHFQLQGGRIVYVPLEDLLAKLRSSAVNQIWKLKDQVETTDTIGPIGGFRMKYTMERVELSSDGRSRGGTFAQLAEWTLVPVQAQLGETVEQALDERSEFRRAVSSADPRLTSITIWTYADSFPEFRRLKKELFRLGYATAGRPLPDGHPIGGSPQGSKSATQ